MAIYWKNFKIEVLPTPPTGYDEASPPPGEEVVTSIPIKTYKHSNWLSDKKKISDKLTEEESHIGEDCQKKYPGEDKKIICCSMQKGMLIWEKNDIVTNIDNAFTLTNPDGKVFQLVSIDYRTISNIASVYKEIKDNLTVDSKTLKAIFGWEQVGCDYIGHNASTTKSFQVTEGISSSKEQALKFSESIGASITATASASADVFFAKVSASVSTKLSTDFSSSQSSSHSVTLSKQTTKTRSWTVGSDTFYQLWQLYVKFATSDGKVLTQKLDEYQLLTYPHPNQVHFIKLPENFEEHPIFQEYEAKMLELRKNAGEEK